MVFGDPNLTRPYELLTYTNTVTDGLLGAVILLLIFIVGFVSMKNYRTSSAFAASAFITTILAVLLRALDVIKDEILFLCIFGTVAGVAFLIFENRGG